MAITDRFVTDFEAGPCNSAGGQPLTVSGGWHISATGGEAHSGSQFATTDSSAGSGSIWPAGATDRTVLSCAVKVIAPPASGISEILSLYADGGTYITFAVDSTGTIIAKIASYPIHQQSGPVIADGVWHAIECQLTTQLTNWLIDWKVDGVPQTPVAWPGSAQTVIGLGCGQFVEGPAVFAHIEWDDWQVGSFTDPTADWYYTWGSGSVELDPSGIVSSEAFGAPTLSGPALLPAGIASEEAFGVAVLDDGHTHPVGIASAEAFGTVTLEPASTLAPGAIGSGEAFGRAWLHDVGQLIAVPGITSLLTFGGPTLTQAAEQFLAPRGIVAEPVLGVPALALTAPAPLAPAGMDSAAQVGTPFVLPAAAAGVTPRNLLIDRLTHEVYPWPVNHATEDPIRTLGRRLTRSGITASGKLIATRRVGLLSHAAHPGPVRLMLNGSLIDRDQQQYATFVRFFEESDDRTFDYVDASGDSYHIAIVSFDARRSNSPARLDGSYFTYALECEVLEVHTGALKGYTV